IDETTTVIKSFIKTYVENAKTKSVVLGLSGGVDSAVATLLCQQALGNKQVKCLFLPDESTPKKDRTDLKSFVETFEVDCTTKDITDLITEVELQGELILDKMSKANLKARMRMVLLYAYANKTKSLVCGTSNKSELLIGYFTKYGDGGVDFMPLGDVYKTQIWEIAESLKLPTCMIEKPPTAGLWKGQTDEKELHMSYTQLDQILYGLERKMDVHFIAKETKSTVEDINRIHQMRVCSQHKRHLPLIPKVGLRTPGLDWRSPVQNG
ncbi:MAG: NAD+ synthase, partial [Thermoplasmatota archaeon]